MNGYFCLAAASLSDIGDSAIEAACNLLTKGCEACSNLLEALGEWDIMNSLSDQSTTFGTVAVTVGKILLTIELCSLAMGFHFEDINEGFKFVFKIIIYNFIIGNSSKFVKIVYGLMFKSDVWNTLASDFNNIGTNFSEIPAKITESIADVGDGTMGIAKLIAALIIAIVAGFAFYMMIKIVISIAGIIFEIGIDIVVAPIPIATLVAHETRQIGINFIKGFASNCLTISMYGVCFTVYNGIVSNITNSFSGLNLTGIFTGVGLILPHLIGLVLLSIATRNASNMMSKILG